MPGEGHRVWAALLCKFDGEWSEVGAADSKSPPRTHFISPGPFSRHTSQAHDRFSSLKHHGIDEMAQQAITAIVAALAILNALPDVGPLLLPRRHHPEMFLRRIAQGHIGCW
jgi:hypothetical protein